MVLEGTGSMITQCWLFIILLMSLKRINETVLCFYDSNLFTLFRQTHPSFRKTVILVLYMLSVNQRMPQILKVYEISGQYDGPSEVSTLWVVIIIITTIILDRGRS